MNHALKNLWIKILFSLKEMNTPYCLTQFQLSFKNEQKKENVTGTDIIAYAAVFMEQSKNEIIVIFMTWDGKH